MSSYLRRDTHRLPFSGKVMKILRIRTHASISSARQTPCSRNFCSWEPFRSFENCGEEVIERFWERVDTKGRDVNSIEGWTNGEEVYPVGPPRTLSYLENHPRTYSLLRPKEQDDTQKGYNCRYSITDE